MLQCKELTIEVPKRTLVRDLDFELAAGEFVSVLGRNGSGKTLTMHSLAGLRPAGDAITVSGQPLSELSRRETARRLGLLLQTYEDPFPSTVIEAVLIGRHPHIDFWRWESDSDYHTARQALAAVDLDGFDLRSIDTLSGGERRRLAIATLITQDPRVVLLDEPTNHLDPHHQVGVLRLFRHQADLGKAVLATLHDPNLAVRFSDKVLMLFGDGEWLFGPIREVVTAEHLSRLYEIEINAVSWGDQQLFVPA